METFGAGFCQRRSRNMNAAGMKNHLGLCVQGRTVAAMLFLQTDAYPAIAFKELLYWVR
jgi:hypothetical protein